MSPGQFKRWRKQIGLSQKDAAHALGLKRRVLQYYEKGERDGKKVQIPLSISLACYALSQGVEGFDGVNVKKNIALEKAAAKEMAINIDEVDDPPDSLA